MNAFYELALSNSENIERWAEKGAKDMRTRAYDCWSDLLDQYEPTPINEATNEALKAFISIRKSVLPDAWY